MPDNGVGDSVGQVAGFGAGAVAVGVDADLVEVDFSQHVSGGFKVVRGFSGKANDNVRGEVKVASVVAEDA